MSNQSDVFQDRPGSKGAVWWRANIDYKITPEVRRVLEQYSNIPSEDVAAHIYEIRDKLWARRPWPCTGLGSFLSPMLPHSPLYPAILKQIKTGATFLDIGCYCGTDMRALAIDQCPQERMYGVDLVKHWDLGLELFRGQDKFHAIFIEGDILEPNAEMQALHGKVDIISATHLLHNWNWATQVKACCNIAAFSKVGSVVVGYQIGTKDSTQAMWDEEVGKVKLTLHTVETFGRMWSEVGERSGMQWKTEATVRDWAPLGHSGDETAWLGKDAGFLEFVVSRTS